MVIFDSGNGSDVGDNDDADGGYDDDVVVDDDDDISHMRDSSETAILCM